MKGLKSWRIACWRALWVLAPFLFHPISSLPAQTSAGEIVINRSSFAPIPRWQNQYLVGSEFQPSSSPPIFAYEINGGKVFERQLTLDGAHQVYVKSMAASRDGRFAATGLAVNLDTRTPYIAFLDRSGQVTRLVRPDHFYPNHLCFTSDGNLWAAGHVGPRSPEPEYDVLRVYGPDGAIKATHLPRKSFASVSQDLAMYPAPAADGGAAIWPQLAANDNSVVFLTIGYQQMVGLSLDGRELFRTKVELAERGMVTGFAVAPDGRVYLSSQEPVAGDPKTYEYVFHMFDPANGKWSAIYRRTSKERGLPRAVAMFDHERMLVDFRAGEYAWVQSSGGGYALGK